jgi:TonB family protein
MSKMYKCSLVALLGLSIGCGGSDKKVESSDKEREVLELDDEAPTGRRSAVPGMDDDDDDEGMQVEGLRGHLDPNDIQEGVRPHNKALASCFESRAKKRYYLGGEVVLAVTVAKDGAVKSARAEKSSLGSHEIERCLLDEAMTMRFVKPKGGDADFTLPLDFDARRPANWWTEEQADLALGDKPEDLSECRQEGTDPTNVWVTLYLGNRGVVQSVGFASPHKDGIDTAWADCAAAKVLAWQLNDPRGKVAKLGFRYNPE